MRYDVKELQYEIVKVAETSALFTSNRVSRESLPEGVFLYEVRHDDECMGEPSEIAKGIMVNFWGSLLTVQQLKEVEENGYMIIGSVDWIPVGDCSYTWEESFRTIS